jgi:hypothetical protein
VTADERSTILLEIGEVKENTKVINQLVRETKKIAEGSEIGVTNTERGTMWTKIEIGIAIGLSIFNILLQWGKVI